MSVAMSEADLLETIRHAAQLGGWLMYHTHDSRRSQAGFPDLVLVRGREAIFAELKTDRGVLRSEQRMWLGALGRAGLRAEVWRPAHLDHVLAELVRRP